MKTYLVSFMRSVENGFGFGTATAKGRLHTGNIDEYQMQLVEDIRKAKPDTTHVTILAIIEIEEE